MTGLHPSEGDELALYAKPKSDLLKAFIHARTFEQLATPRGHKWPNKLNLQQAREGKDCLVLRAYNLRGTDVMLKLAPLPPVLNRKSRTLQEEKLHAIGLLVEHVFDLMIGEADNVSESPGFESLGLVGRSRDA